MKAIEVAAKVDSEVEVLCKANEVLDNDNAKLRVVEQVLEEEVSWCQAANQALEVDRAEYTKDVDEAITNITGVLTRLGTTCRTLSFSRGDLVKR
ncbi:hypothetical protein GUJ93_ZPchr0009g2315 [Zizania palustris]|uniref:Uncharacterized protein n=1 Tax=Zizania palustris TaxID=103762 RepID=A0A8J5V9A8_ZIZPA|nr:hypothetical protein GUJ93_ZPchr0009g2315 [Zizania palustris]